MSEKHTLDGLEQAKKLIGQGWHTNLGAGSVTRDRDQRSGLVDDAVWQAMNFLQAEQGWVRTEPQPIAPSGSWNGPE